MKKFLVLALVAAALVFVQDARSQAVAPLVQSQIYTGGSAPGGQPFIFESATVGTHTLYWVTSGTVSTCTVQLETSAAGSTFVLMAGSVAQTCTTTGSVTFEGATANYVRFNITAFSATGTVSFTYVGTPLLPVANFTDGVWNVPWGSCSLTVPVTGVWAAGPASAGTYVGPLMVQAVTKNQLLQGTTTAAASAPNLDCDITPPTRSTTGKGVTVTGYQVYYAVQTSALTSVTTPTLSTITFPASGAAAAGTIAAAGGTQILTPASFTLTTSATGVCQSQNVTFTTPVSLNTANQRLQMEIIFNQTAASALTLQICGLQVFYQNAPL